MTTTTYHQCPTLHPDGGIKCARRDGHDDDHKGYGFSIAVPITWERLADDPELDANDLDLDDTEETDPL
jgi:hypothetical protein